jgi:arylsulfatase A-like enzyme
MTHTPDLPLHPDQVKTAPYGTGEARKELLRGYYAAITAMDEGIGRIIDALTATGLPEQTVVLFTSDNGMNMGHHGIWGKGNGTFPLNLYDTSVKVPLIVQLPGGPRGQVSHELLSQYDFMPTICELAGLSIPAAPERPGRSFARHLRNPGLPTRDEVVVFDEYGPARMIRTQRFKYIHRYPYGPHEFYDLEQDPDETRNRYEEEACQAEIASLRARLADWFHRYSDPAADGSREGVTGKGQIDRAGIAARGRPNYAPPPGYARDDQV